MTDDGDLSWPCVVLLCAAYGLGLLIYCLTR